MSKTSEDGATRRNFLKIAVTAAPAAFVAVASGTSAVAASPADLASNKMQDTAHTRAYLDSVRF
tara:strand:- start:13 stop:204 length:192 start_codon:yes stop_codon:yes gene_type:complete